MIARNQIPGIIPGIWALFLAVFLAAFPVAAQETEPGDACPTAGLFRASGGVENPDGHLLYCDGAAWQPILGYSSAGGEVMLGSAGLAAAPLHVWGEAIIGSEGLPCTAPAEGALRYLSATDAWEFCDGATWTALGSGSISALNDLSDVDTTGFSDGNVLMYSAGASGWVPGVVSGGGGLVSIQKFTTSGTWTKPAGVTTILVYVTGGGGGGGSGGFVGGGGGAGTAVKAIDVSAVNSVAITIGNGGNAGSGGQSSSFGAYASATGGTAPGSCAAGGSGGNGSGGDLNFAGGAGGAGDCVSVNGSAGLSYWAFLSASNPYGRGGDPNAAGTNGAVIVYEYGGGGSGGSGDNLGNHTATQNIILGANWLSGDGDNEGIYLGSTGNVGIGTGSPVSGLDVRAGAAQSPSAQSVTAGLSGSYASIELKGATSATGGGFIDFGYPSNDFQGRIIYNNSDDSIALYTAATEKLRIDNSGNVGVGTASPTAPFEVVGEIKFSSSGLACTGTRDGSIRYVSSGASPPWEFCNGSAWVPFKQPRCQDDDTGECYLAVTRSNDDPDFLPENICNGINILGVVGTGTCAGAGSCGTTETFNTAGTHSYTVPSSFSTITIKLWGAGGSGGNSGLGGASTGGSGGSTTVSSLSLTAGGGGGGGAQYCGAPCPTDPNGGAGGAASGGDTNTAGNTGGNYFTGTGANAPNGGTGGSGGSNPGGNGTAPGAGGGGASGFYGNAGGGGSGAYVEKQYTPGTLSGGTNITDIVVGAGGVPGGSGNPGGSGADGQVSITCVP